MHCLIKLSFAAAALAAPAASASTPEPAPPAPALQGGIGDLLVAPTRLVLDGRKGAEIILSNIGTEPSTYRVSVEFRRMTEEGGLEDVAEPDARDKIAQDMIVYAPRRVTLAPRQPQSIRIAARAPAGIPDGEYRVHMLFRAVPPATPVAAQSTEQPKGISFALVPVYGVTIPVIVRLGNLHVKAGIENVQLETKDGRKAVTLDLTRNGERSTYGEVRVLKPGVKDPIARQRAVAVYTEVGKRHVIVPLDEGFAGDVRGPVIVQYVETFDDGSHTLAEVKTVLR